MKPIGERPPMRERALEEVFYMRTLGKPTGEPWEAYRRKAGYVRERVS